MSDTIFTYNSRIPVLSGRVPYRPQEPNIIITTGLVQHFDATDSNSYPGTGTTWFNLSTGNDATLTNNPTFVSSSPQYFDFSLTNYAAADYAASTTGSYTFCAWVKGVQSSSERIFTSLSGTNYWGLDIQKSTSNILRFRAVRTSPNTAEEVLNSNVTLQNNVWYYICGSIAPNNIVATNNQKIYINGQFNAQRTATGTAWRIGNLINIGRLDQGFNLGDVDVSDVHLYDRILSDAEILYNYNATKAKYGY